MNKDPKTLTHHLIFSRAALIIRLWRTHNKNLPNWIIPMSDDQGNDLLSRMKSQQKLVHLDLSKWQTTAKNNWSRFADKRSPLLISFFSLSTSVIPCFSNFPWHCRVFGFIEIWRQSVRSTAKLIGRGDVRAIIGDRRFVRNLTWLVIQLRSWGEFWTKKVESLLKYN